MAARIRTSEPMCEEEVRTMLNRSNNSIYFTTWTEHYHLGMRLRVTFPYTSAIDLYSSERGAEVVRIDRLTDGRLGISVRILLP